MNIQYCEAFVKLVDLAEALGKNNIKALPGCCEIVIDDTWKVAINGHGKMCQSQFSKLKNPVPPYSAYVEFKNQIGAMLSVDAGWFLGYPGCNENAFIAACERRIESERQFAIVPDSLTWDQAKLKHCNAEPFESADPDGENFRLLNNFESDTNIVGAGEAELREQEAAF